jgi:hypothetical protein
MSENIQQPAPDEDPDDSVRTQPKRQMRRTAPQSAPPYSAPAPSARLAAGFGSASAYSATPSTQAPEPEPEQDPYQQDPAEPEAEPDDPPSASRTMGPIDTSEPSQDPNPARPGVPDLRITIWGGPGSGKTTFLTVLGVAAEQAYRDPKIGPWAMTPFDLHTETAMRDIRAELTGAGRLPDATKILDTSLSWTMHGPSNEAEPEPRRPWSRKPAKKLPPPEFLLRVPDVPGEFFRHGGIGSTGPLQAELLDELAASDGIIYLFDPVSERKDHSSFTYLDGLLESLRRRTRELGGFVGGRLPHCLAVCVTKFDEPEVHDIAARAGLLREDPQGQPYVPSGKPSARLFGLLCKQFGGSAPLVQNSLRSNFAADRVQYYTTSSVGFRLAENFGIHPSDSYNLMLKDGWPVVRDTVSPINVLEPVIELERLISEKRAR